MDIKERRAELIFNKEKAIKNNDPLSVLFYDKKLADLDKLTGQTI